MVSLFCMLLLLVRRTIIVSGGTLRYIAAELCEALSVHPYMMAGIYFRFA